MLMKEDFIGFEVWYWFGIQLWNLFSLKFNKLCFVSGLCVFCTNGDKLKASSKSLIGQKW